MDKMLAYIGIQPLYADYVGTANKIIVITPDYKIVKKDLNADGTFSIDLDTSTSSAIFLVNDTTKEVVGSVSIPVSSGSDVTLDMMPKGKITKDLELGKLTYNIKKGIATTKSVNIEKDLGNDNTTKELAAIDDLSKLYGNVYRNTDIRLAPNTRFYLTKENGNNLTPSDIIDTPFNPNNDKIIFSGTRLDLTTASGFTGYSATDIKIYFPTNGSKISYQKFSAEAMFTGKDSGANGYLGLNSETDWTVSYEVKGKDQFIKTDDSIYGSQKITTKLASGQYTVKVDGTTKGMFDLVQINAFTNDATSPLTDGVTNASSVSPIMTKMPILIPTLITDSSDSTKYNKIQIKFQISDNGTYSDLSNEAVELLFASSNYNNFFCEYGDSTNEMPSVSKMAKDITTNNMEITLDNSLSKSELNKIQCGYFIYGNWYEVFIKLN